MLHAADLSASEEYVTGLFNQNERSYLIFHNLQHTQRVVLRCKEIASWYSFNDTDTIVLLIAAWFHDTGHLFADMAQHEEESVSIMKSFLKSRNASEADISTIGRYIMATRLPQQPQSFPETILCDADLYHLGTDDFKITDQQVRKEIELRTGKKNKNWEAQSLQLLLNHTYFTSYCRERLQKGKESNIQFLRDLIKEQNG